MKNLKISVLIAISLMLLLFAGCNTMNKTDDAQIKKTSEPMVEDILTGIKEENYSKFSQNFDATMKEKLNEAAFKDLTSMLKNKIGNFISKEYWKSEKSGTYTRTFYNAKYDNETENVIVTVVFSEKDNKDYVSGLFFSSPNLAKQ